MTKSKIAGALAAIVMLSFAPPKSLKGTWLYDGGVFNGNKETAPKDYQLQRKYTDAGFEAFMLEKGAKPQKYQAGKYKMLADSCLETETYSLQRSKLTGKTVRYHAELKNDVLILTGKLPTGIRVEEHWKKAR